MADKACRLPALLQMLIALRKRHPALRRREFFRGTGRGRFTPGRHLARRSDRFSPISPAAAAPSPSPGRPQTGREPDRDFYVACNAWIRRRRSTYRVPLRASVGGVAIDTALPAPLDLLELDQGPVVPQETDYMVQEHSLLVLIAES